MPYTPHWKRDTSQLRSRQDQIADEAKLDKRIPRLKKRVAAPVEAIPKKGGPERKTFTLNH